MAVGLCMRCACDVALKPDVRVSLYPTPTPLTPLPLASLSCDVGEHEETYVKGKAGRGG